MRIVLACLTAILAAGCCSQGPRAHVNFDEAEHLFRQMRYKHDILALAQGAQGEIERVLEQNPHVSDAEAVLDWEIYACGGAYSSRMPFIILIDWKPDVQVGEAEVTALLRETFVRAKFAQEPEITSMSGAKGKTAIVGSVRMELPPTLTRRSKR